MFIGNTPNFSAIRQGLSKAGGDQVLSYTSAKGLHVRSGTSPEFLDAFRSKGRLEERATLRDVAIGKIKEAIDAEFGAGMGARAFEYASRDGHVPRSLTKNDLDHLDNAIKRLHASDHAPANARFGLEKTIDGLFDDGVRDGCLKEGRPIDDATRNALKNQMVMAVAALPEGSPPAQCRRAAQHVLLKFDLDRDFDEKFKGVAEDQKALQRGKLDALMNRLLVAPLKSVWLRETAHVLREACTDGKFEEDCEAQLEQLATHWAPGHGDRPKVDWKVGAHRTDTAPDVKPKAEAPAAKEAPPPAESERVAFKAATPKGQLKTQASGDGAAATGPSLDPAANRKRAVGMHANHPSAAERALLAKKEAALKVMGFTLGDNKLEEVEGKFKRETERIRKLLAGELKPEQRDALEKRLAALSHAIKDYKDCLPNDGSSAG